MEHYGPIQFSSYKRTKPQAVYFKNMMLSKAYDHTDANTKTRVLIFTKYEVFYREIFFFNVSIILLYIISIKDVISFVFCYRPTNSSEINLQKAE